jgi:hypothetical protein
MDFREKLVSVIFAILFIVLIIPFAGHEPLIGPFPYWIFIYFVINIILIAIPLWMYFSEKEEVKK